MPFSTITIRDEPDGFDVSISFDPPYSEESPLPCHDAAIRAVQLLSESMGDPNPEVKAMERGAGD